MLFRKKMEHFCAYCTHSCLLDDGQLLCAKRGLVDESDECPRFRYDPCKRIPAKKKAPDFSKYDEEDFSL